MEITVEDDEIDDYKVELKTDRPQDIDWDLNLVQKPGKEQKVTKVVEEVSKHAVTFLQEISYDRDSLKTKSQININGYSEIIMFSNKSVL